jgi:hypothetical protein
VLGIGEWQTQTTPTVRDVREGERIFDEERDARENCQREREREKKRIALPLMNSNRYCY